MVPALHLARPRHVRGSGRACPRSRLRRGPMVTVDSVVPTNRPFNVRNGFTLPLRNPRNCLDVFYLSGLADGGDRPLSRHHGHAPLRELSRPCQGKG